MTAEDGWYRARRPGYVGRFDVYNRGVNEAPPPGTRADAISAPQVRRPAAVTILAILQLLSAAVYGLIFATLLMSGPAVLEALTGNAVLDAGLEAGIITVLVGGLCLTTSAAGVLLLRMRQLGWTLTMLLAGLGLASSIYLWWAQGTTLTIPVIIQVVTVFYLNQRQVMVAFGISRRRADDTFDLGRG